MAAVWGICELGSEAYHYTTQAGWQNRENDNGFPIISIIKQYVHGKECYARTMGSVLEALVIEVAYYSTGPGFDHKLPPISK
jgi:hypothetical protein